MQIVRGDETVLVPASHENPLAPGVWKKVLFQKAAFQAGAVQMINWARLPAGNRFAAHYHEDLQEVFLIVHGEAEMTVAGRTSPCGPAM